MKKTVMNTTVDFNITGTTFGKRQGYLCDLEKHPERRVFLWREPRNKADANAIKVMADAASHGKPAKYDLGYVPRQLAAELAPLMDAGTFVEIKEWAVVGGKGLTRGLKIHAAYRK